MDGVYNLGEECTCTCSGVEYLLMNVGLDMSGTGVIKEFDKALEVPLYLATINAFSEEWLMYKNGE